MNDLEKAVVQAAIALTRIGHEPSVAELNVLRNWTWELIFQCNECNTDRHCCGGCGADVGHGDYACPNCTADANGENTPPVPWAPLSAFTALASAELGQCLCSRSERMYCHRDDCHGGADLPEKGIGVPKCPVDGQWCSTCRIGGSNGTGGACARQRHDGGQEMLEQELGWVLRTIADVRPGDTVRMPGQEETRQRVAPHGVVALPWHVHPAANEYRPHEMPAEWTQIRVRFEGENEVYGFAPDMPVEIELAPSEVAAIEMLGWSNRVGMEIGETK